MLIKYQMAAVLGSLEGIGSGHLVNPQHRVCHPIGSMTEHPTFGREISGSPS